VYVAVARVTKPPDVGENVTRTDILPRSRSHAPLSHCPNHAARTANAGAERRRNPAQVLARLIASTVHEVREQASHSGARRPAARS
jgi:hypothetical protein